MSLFIILYPERIGNPALGIIIPAAVLLISIIATWMLYKKFSKSGRDK